MVVEDI